MHHLASVAACAPTPTMIGIVGWKKFNDYQLFIQHMNSIVSRLRMVTIISGGCRGTDALARRYAEDGGYHYVEFSANWKRYGKSAGPIRNRQIVNSSNLLVAFLSPKSIGTRNTIKFARVKGVDVIVIDVS